MLPVSGLTESPREPAGMTRLTGVYNTQVPQTTKCFHFSPEEGYSERGQG